MTAALLLGVFAFGVSLLTLFSGFGLGTLLMPAFALFLPVPVAVAATAVVHFANNAFKAGLLLGRARRDVVLRFGLPALVAAGLGAALLARLAGGGVLASWRVFGHEAVVTPVKLVMGLLILGFALFELLPALRGLRAPPRWLPLGGALSGFFGGLSGHQGALRAAFLSPLGLSPPEFASTQAVLALLVDAVRLPVYGLALFGLAGGPHGPGVPWRLVATTTLFAFAGAFLGKRMLHAVTLTALHHLTGGLLLMVGAGLALGIL